MNPYWSYVLTAVGVFGLWLAGRKDPRGWVVGLLAQVLWIAYATATHQWGFYVSSVAYGLVYARNVRLWLRPTPGSAASDLLLRLQRAEHDRDDERAARKIAGGAADRFRDVLSEVLDLDENPGDDELVRQIRDAHGKYGPESTRWRDFIVGARAVIDQIEADRSQETP